MSFFSQKKYASCLRFLSLIQPGYFSSFLLSQKRIRWSLSLLAILLTISSCEKFDLYSCMPPANAPHTNLITEEKATNITEAVCHTLNDNELIGIQVSIRDSLDEEWRISGGAIDLEQQTDMENHHILRIGSVTKIFTATLIMQLIEQNVLELDQPLSDFYPAQDNISGITIRHLLNHSSGIIDLFSLPSIFISASNFPGKHWDPNQKVEVCMNKKLRFPPGSDYSYSNTNYLLLGLIAKQASGKSISQLLEEYILEPLELNNTYLVPYMPAPAALTNGYVHRFALSLQEWYTTEPENTSWSTIGFTAGAMVSNASDLSAFLFHLFNGDLLDETSLEMMTTFQDNHGFGLFRIKVNDQYYWGHEGEITGFESIAVFNPTTNIIISICCNTTPFKINNLLNEIDAFL